MVIVKDIIQITDYINEAYISFENKNNEIESHPISLFKKVKTYLCFEVNHKPGDFFFSLKEINRVREKNIVYREIDFFYIHGNNNSKKVYYRSLDNLSSSISELDTIVFINVNNNLDLKCNEYKKNNSYLKLLDSINKQDMVKNYKG